MVASPALLSDESRSGAAIDWRVAVRRVATSRALDDLEESTPAAGAQGAVSVLRAGT